MGYSQHIVLRRARAGDALTLADLHIQTWRATYQGIVPRRLLERLDLGQRTALWLKRLSRPSPLRRTYLIEVGDQAAGFVSFGPDREEEGRAEIYAIYLLPQHQRKGLGTALMRRALTDLRSFGYAEVAMWIMVKNTATRFCSQLGGEYTESRTGRLTGATESCFLYQL